MAAGGQNSGRQKNSLAQRAVRAAGREKEQQQNPDLPERLKKGEVSGAFGKDFRSSSASGRGGVGGGGMLSKSSIFSVGASHKAARKRGA